MIVARHSIDTGGLMLRYEDDQTGVMDCFRPTWFLFDQWQTGPRLQPLEPAMVEGPNYRIRVMA